MIGVSERIIVNWEKEKTKAARRNTERIREILGGEPLTH
jgi:predicted transcriptional regulator